MGFTNGIAAACCGDNSINGNVVNNDIIINCPTRNGSTDAAANMDKHDNVYNIPAITASTLVVILCIPIHDDNIYVNMEVDPIARISPNDVGACAINEDIDDERHIPGNTASLGIDVQMSNIKKW
jgi:hypothetical protein